MAENDRMFIPHDCTSCPLGRISGSKLVWGEGSLGSNSVMLLGIAPGRKEDEEGRPFVGQSGEVLRRNLGILEKEGLGWYITNVVKHRPPGNRNPKPEEKKACLPWLITELDRWEGKVIVAFGEAAIKFFAPTVRSVGPVIRVPIPVWGGRIVIPSYHPSNVVRNLAPETEIQDSLRVAADIASGKVEVVHTKKTYTEWDGERITAEVIGLDTESLEGGEPFGLSISDEEGRGYWVAEDDVRRFWHMGMGERWPKTVMHFASHDIKVLEQMGLPRPDDVEDTQVLAHLKGYDIGLKALTLALEGFVMTPFKEMVSAVGGKLEDVPREVLLPYAIGDADYTRRAWFKLKFGS